MATRSWNRAELIGNLTRDPELRYTPSGAAVCTFSIATNRSYVADGERKEEVDFHRIVAWNKLAELCSQLLKKGIRVFISGRLQNRSWEDQSGQTRNITEIVIDDMLILTNKNSSESGEEVLDELPVKPAVSSKQTTVEPKEEKPEAQKVAEAPAETKPQEVVNEDDLPF